MEFGYRHQLDHTEFQIRFYGTRVFYIRSSRLILTNLKFGGVVYSEE
jgi:hypothetical protein